MSCYRIDKGIPPPTAKQVPTVIKTYPWDSMDVRDSFLVTDHPERISAVVSQRNKRHPEKRFVTAKEGNGIRVWRVK
jgi:hypothetical protein